MNDTVASAPDVDTPQTGIAEYSATEAGLAALRSRMAGRVYDVTTTKGMDEAKKDRAELRSLRVNLDKLRKKLNEDDQARIKFRNAKASEITAEIEKLEDPIDSQIKAREEEQEIARQERERAKAEELRKINEALSAIERAPLDMVGKTADEIAEAIAALAGNTLEDFDEVHLPTAQSMRDKSLEKLRAMHTERVSLDEQRAELQRLQDAQAEQDRIAQVERDRQDAEARDRRAEEDRKRAIDEHIDDLSAYARQSIGKPSADVAAAREELASLCLTAELFGERVHDAEQARVRVLEQLNTTYAEAVERERMAAEQADRQRQLDEQEERQRQERAEREESERIEREQAEERRREEARAEQQRQAEEQRARWLNRKVQKGAVMTNSELDALCQLLIVSDPWPLPEVDQSLLADWADVESRRHGFTNWVDALHGIAALRNVA